MNWATELHRDRTELHRVLLVLYRKLTLSLWFSILLCVTLWPKPYYFCTMITIRERPITHWLPITKKEIEQRGWDEVDVILISGDAYVDHPSFGTAVIGRIIESEGFRVAIIPQPNWRDDLRDFKKLGKPKYFFGVDRKSVV